jgi:aminoglycoside phosphotransferase
MSAGLAPDFAVRHRDLLLDAEAMAPRLGRLLGRRGALAVDACRRGRVKYRPGESLRVLYALDVGGRRERVALRTFPGERGDRVFERAAERATDRGPLRGVVRDPELGAVLFTFPNDRKIAGLRRLLARPGPGVAASRLVAWAPEKCATVRRVDAKGRTLAYAKAYAGDEGARTRGVHDALRGPAAAAGLRLPWAISYDPEHRVLECEALDGRPLAALEGSELEAGMRRLGAALAHLHRLEAPPLAPPFERLEPTELRRAASLIAALRPDCSGAARELADRLITERPQAATAVCLHGDVHPKNALVGDAGLALVDLDQVALGPAAADIGGILAGLRYRRLIGELSAAAEDTLAQAVLDGYAAAGGRLDPADLRWHAAAALLSERALRAITRVRPRGIERLSGLLAEADATLASATEVAA